VRGNGWRNFTALLITTALAFCLPAVFRLPTAEAQNTSAIQTLKPGKGRELVLVNCMPCHSTAIIAATHATRERWDELVTTMQQKHGLWPLVPAVRNQILDYLAATQPPSDPALDAAKQTPWAKPLYRPNPLW
jgi:mono/diheme cytochrome c family protein